MFNRTWLEIDTGAFEDNLRKMRESVSPAELLAVLKADAYGLGARTLSLSAIRAGAARIGVATAAEAVELKEQLASHATIPLQVMSAVFPEELEALIAAGIEIPLHEARMLPEINGAASRLGLLARVHVKLDTGMGRLGLLPDELPEVLALLRKCGHIKPVGIFTHFPRSTEHEPEYCRAQVEQVKKAIALFEAAGISLRWRHVANSDAICHFPETAMPPFNLVRAGLAMHGLVDMGESRPTWLREVASFKSRLVSVRTMPAGSCIGYGATFKLAATTRIGTIAAGYADGLPLALSNRGKVIVNGCPCPIVGRISMDYTTIDLTCAPQASVGDVVTLFGRDGHQKITPSEWALAKGTHPYDIICSIAPRVPRVAR